MEYGPPPLFNQGVSARARLAFFSVVAALLIVIDAQVNALDVIRNGVEILLYPFQRVLLWPRDVVGDFAGYFISLSDLNEENARLRKIAVEQSQRAQLAGELQLQNEQLRKLAGLRERVSPPAQLVTALYESRDPFSHKIVIDHGSKDGILPGGPVIDEFGVVGQVTRIFPMTAEVTLLTDKEQSLPVQISRNGLRAVAFGGSEPMTLELRFLPSNADIQSGDSVVTSGLDGMYPTDMPVGTVTRIDRDVKDQFARVILKPVGGMSKSRLLLVLLVNPPPVTPATGGHEDASGSVRGDRAGAKAARR